jgi:hypothetical protein
MPLVKYCNIALLFWVLLSAFRYSTGESPIGTWKCVSRSGQWDAHTKYQLNCSGEIEFCSNNTIISTCPDAFSPTGSIWATEDTQLTLSDSEGTLIVAYTWKKIDERTLMLEKKGIIYMFDRVFKPQTAGN